MEKCPYCEGKFVPAGGIMYECAECGATFGMKIDLTRKIIYRKEGLNEANSRKLLLKKVREGFFLS